MRHLAVQMFDWLGALSQSVSSGDLAELEIVAIFCGVGLDASLWSLVSSSI